MRVGYRGSIGAALVTLAVLTLSPRLVAQQAKEAASQPRSPKTARTPWGDPDLQGIWSSFTKTPFQRRLPGEPQASNDEDGPELGAAGNSPALRDPLSTDRFDTPAAEITIEFFTCDSRLTFVTSA